MTKMSSIPNWVFTSFLLDEVGENENNYDNNNPGIKKMLFFLASKFRKDQQEYKMVMPKETTRKLKAKQNN